MTLPIAEHGLIGDLRSAALVGTDGTVDWFCPRRFDAPSVFASLLDDAAGHWSMAPPPAGERGPLRVMYTIDGEPPPAERRS